MTNRNIKTILLLLVLFSIAILFLSEPFQLFSTPENEFPRWLFFFLPLTAGSDSQPSPSFFDTDRLKIIGLGLCELAAIWGLGKLFLAFLGLSSSRKKKDLSEFQITRLETGFFSILLGFALLSILLSAIGFFGGIGSYLKFPLWFLSAGGIFLFSSCLLYQYREFTWPKLRFSLFAGTVTLLIVLFVLIYLLAGTIPPFEYDMLEYHLQGPREILESGRIGFFPHNIYLNMPLGTEMIYLAGLLMNPFPGTAEADSLIIGVTAAKWVLSFILLSAVFGLTAFLRRLTADEKSGEKQLYTAALFFLAFPELFQVTSNGLVDSISGFFLFGTVFALYLIFSTQKKNGNTPFPLSVLAGFSAGFACAVKYTSLPFLLLPAILTVIWLYFHLNIPQKKIHFSLFCGSAFLGGGGWYLKNLILTGNPFYPLGYHLFGDRTGLWNELKNERWHTAHSSADFSFSAFCSDLNRLFTDDFAGFLFAVFFLLIILSLISSFRKRKITPFSFLTFYLFVFYLLWWFATHRYLRFLVPVLPIAAILLTLAWKKAKDTSSFKFARYALDLLLIIGSLYGLAVDLTAASGFLTPISTLIRDQNRYGETAFLIDQNPSLVPRSGDSRPQKLLLIGDIRPFAYRKVPVLYSTCWDDSPLRSLVPRTEPDGSGKWEWSNEEITEIKDRFRNAQIGALLVDRREIIRFLSPGNYGLTDEKLMTPSFFQSLQKAGILKEKRIGSEVKFYTVNTGTH